MATPKCIACGSTEFKSTEMKITGYRFPINLIHCNNCGGILGVMPEYDPGVVAQKNGEKLDEIIKKLKDSD